LRRHAKASSVGSTEGRAADRQRFAPLGVAAGPLISLALLLLPSSALAAEAHPFLGAFGAASQPSFAEAEGLAVDQSNGDLLVIDGEANTVSRFKPNGEPDPFSALGTNVIDASKGPGGKPCAEEPASCDLNEENPGLTFGTPGEVQIAVDNSGGATDGNIYVPQDEGPKIVDVFAKDGSFLGQLSESSEGPFAFPCGVAVDPSGNLYLGDFSGHIHKYEPTANPPVNADNSDNFEFASNCTLAAGAGPTAGFIFAAHFHGAVAKLDSASGKEKYDINAGETTTVSVDPATGHLYIAIHESSAVKELDASGASSATEVSSTTLPNEARGVATYGSTGNLYTTRFGSFKAEVFGPLAPELPLLLKKGGSGEGSVQSTPAGISCGPACPEETAEFVEGELITLQASASSNSEFSGWSTLSGNPGTCTATTTPCQVTISAALELQANFTHLPAPTVGALSPAKGPTGGGNLVEISGTGLAKATQVQLGKTVLNPPFTEDTATKITLKAPEHAAGTLDVIVSTGGGASANTAADDYTFIAPPAVTALSPAKGPTTGGNTVEISGLRLAEASAVQFGETTIEAPFTEDTATKITLKAPPNAAETVDVRVVTPGGSSANFAADDYTYEVPAPPPPKPLTPTASLTASPPSALPQCVVPKLKGLTLARARSALNAAHCASGKVSKPKAKKPGPLLVRSSTPGAGTALPAGSAVDLKLAPKPKQRKKS
jgi:hypothetical protein